jgi:hypothetical protein
MTDPTVGIPSHHVWLSHHDEVGMLAGLVAICSYIPYIRSTVAGRTHPNRVSWWAWAVLGAISFFGYLRSGSTSDLWVPALAAIGPFAVALLSIRYGTGGATRSDLVSLVGCAVGLGAGWAVGSAAVGLGIMIAVDTLASVPTLLKSTRSPYSENLLAWSFAFLGAAVNLLAVDQWTLFAASYPVYLVAINGSFVAVLVVGRASLGR